MMWTKETEAELVVYRFGAELFSIDTVGKIGGFFQRRLVGIAHFESTPSSCVSAA
jgi:hypothetical protein